MVLAQGNVCEPAFREPVAYPTGVNPCALTIGDIDLDGHLDLVVANCSSLNASILFGVGDGSFESPQNLNLGVTPGDVAVGDIDEDGHPDVVICARNYSHLLICWGEGNRAFTLPTTLASPPSPSRLRVADLDGDSHLDLIMNGDLEGVAVIWGDASRTPPDHTVFGLPTPAFTLQLADLNLDGRKDMAVASCADSSLFVLWNQGSRTFSTPTLALSAPGAYLCNCSFGSIGDGAALDVACVDESSYLGRIDVALGDGVGGFRNLKAVGVGLIPLDATVADLNGDGADDIAVTNSGSADVSLIDGDTFALMQTLEAGPCPARIQASDLNDDRYIDLVVLDECAGYVQVYLSWGKEIIGSVEFSPNPYSVRTGTNLTASITLPDAVAEPIDPLHVLISEGGRALGRALSLNISDEGKRITTVFDGRTFDDLSTGVREVAINGCGDGMRPFGVKGTLEIARARLVVQWTSMPGRRPVILQVNGALSRTELRIFSSTGTLVRWDTIDEGSNSYIWDGLSESGATVSSGVYLVQARRGGISGSCKVILLR